MGNHAYKNFVKQFGEPTIERTGEKIALTELQEHYHQEQKEKAEAPKKPHRPRIQYRYTGGERKMMEFAQNQLQYEFLVFQQQMTALQQDIDRTQQRLADLKEQQTAMAERQAKLSSLYNKNKQMLALTVKRIDNSVTGSTE